MIELQQCRRCRVKLPAPADPKVAFCCRGCHRMFYDKHCMVCEEPLTRRSAAQKRCVKCAMNRRSLDTTLIPHWGKGRPSAQGDSGSLSVGFANPIKIGVPEAEPLLKIRVIGPPLSDIEYRAGVKWLAEHRTAFQQELARQRSNTTSWPLATR